jgi:heme A synthase
MNEPQKPNGKHDVWTHRIVALCLGLVVLLTGASITALAMLGKDVPPALPALGGTALGALSGMLAAVMRERG